MGGGKSDGGEKNWRWFAEEAFLLDALVVLVDACAGSAFWDARIVTCLFDALRFLSRAIASAAATLLRGGSGPSRLWSRR